MCIYIYEYLLIYLEFIFCLWIFSANVFLGVEFIFYNKKVDLSCHLLNISSVSLFVFLLYLVQ